jgi:hypothetical protein
VEATTALARGAPTADPEATGDAPTSSWPEEVAKVRAEAEEHLKAAERYEEKLAESVKAKAAADSSQIAGKSSKGQAAKPATSASEDSRTGSGLQTIAESDGESYKSSRGTRSKKKNVAASDELQHSGPECTEQEGVTLNLLGEVQT